MEEDGHLARLADHAVALEADAGDVVAGAVAMVHNLALLLVVLAGLVLSQLLLSEVPRRGRLPRPRASARRECELRWMASAGAGSLQVSMSA